MSYPMCNGVPVMNIKSIRKILWNPKSNRRPVFEQLQLKLPASRLTRDETDVLNDLRRLRERLAKA